MIGEIILNNHKKKKKRNVWVEKSARTNKVVRLMNKKNCMEAHHHEYSDPQGKRKDLKSFCEKNTYKVIINQINIKLFTSNNQCQKQYNIFKILRAKWLWTYNSVFWQIINHEWRHRHFYTWEDLEFIPSTDPFWNYAPGGEKES